MKSSSAANRLRHGPGGNIGLSDIFPLLANLQKMPDAVIYLPVTFVGVDKKLVRVVNHDPFRGIVDRLTEACVFNRSIVRTRLGLLGTLFQLTYALLELPYLIF